MKISVDNAFIYYNSSKMINYRPKISTLKNDQNPIENSWEKVVRQVCSNCEQYQTLLKLKNAVMARVEIFWIKD